MMKPQRALLIIILLFGQVLPVGHAQKSISNYADTRKLLLKMERSQGNKELEKLFEEADIRMPDLISALNDSEKKISINAQVIIKYLAEPDGLQALSEWYKTQQLKEREVWMPKMELLAEEKYLEGNDSDLVKLAMKNKKLFEASRFNSGDIWIKMIAYNKRSRAALLEVVEGQIFTAGWHAVIKEENNRWRLLSDNNVWVT
jgi:hypothetical protein